MPLDRGGVELSKSCKLKLSWDELRRKLLKGEDVKLSWDELRRMPVERVLLGVGLSDPRRRVPSHVGGCAGPSRCRFSFPSTAFSVRAIRSRLGAGIASTTMTRSPQLVAARCFLGPAARCFCGPQKTSRCHDFQRPLDCAPAARSSRSSSCPSPAFASEMTLQARTKDMQNTMATSPASSRVMLWATSAHITHSS